MLKFVALCSVLIALSCGRTTQSVAPKQFQVRGEVIRIDREPRTVTLKHGKIEGWMEAMTMEFPVHNAAELDKLAPGKQVTATVFVTPDQYWIENVQLVSP